MKTSSCSVAKNNSLFTGRTFRILVLGLLLLIVHLLGYAQDRSHQYMSITKRVLNGQITNKDFRGSTVFLTLDTTDAADIFCESTFVETINPDEIIGSFKNFMTSFDHDDKLYYYGEFLESPFHECRNILYGSFNSNQHTYVLNLWMDKDNPNLIEGITISKRAPKTVPGGTYVYFKP